MLGANEIISGRRWQFQKLLSSMNLRAHEEASGSCFIRFSQWDEANDNERFVQFSFENDCFHIDLPVQTLSPAEAAEIISLNRGFFYLSEGKSFTLRGEDVEGFDPFRSVYLYGEEKKAAEDMASIFYLVWKLDSAQPILVSAASFNGDHHWETDEVIPFPDMTLASQARAVTKEH